ncbi:hypothetical protein BJ322DRAFT_528213 [Thelephora terrestris]|uniref:F-box domain-containing protein n=1 Tax=Thelephora terrestris TaxID=56493 RepID=A0A9P6LAE8_9AGAM|nr:hypothetical protein BJ322DRAFT_528213 [Thelephora terrestris]
MSQFLRVLSERQLDKDTEDIRSDNQDTVMIGTTEITTLRNSLDAQILPELRSLESSLQPISRLPKEIFILIPHYFGWKPDWEPGPYSHPTTNIPLIAMTHVCRSWRSTLLSTPSLWTKIDFSVSTNPQQALEFLHRSSNQLLDVFQNLESLYHLEPFLSITLRNIHRLRSLEIYSSHPYVENVLDKLTMSAPELRYFAISNDPDITRRDVGFPTTVFKGQLPKLATLSLHYLRTNLRTFNFPCLTRFEFTTGTTMSVQDMTSFFERSPSLEFVQICLPYLSQPFAAPPRKRVQLTALRELRLDQTACVSGLLDHLTLPRCTEMMLKGQFTGETSDYYGFPAARIHPSSIDYLPVTREITKAVAMPNSCILSGPNGNLGLWCFEGRAREDFDAEFFTSLSPIDVLEIKELWVGHSTTSFFYPGPWLIDIAGVSGAFAALTRVEDLTVVGCNSEPFSSALGMTDADGGILLPELQSLTIYVVFGDLDIEGLIRCAKTRKEHSRPFWRVTLVFRKEVAAKLIREMRLLRKFVGEVDHRVGEAPTLIWKGVDRDDW